MRRESCTAAFVPFRLESDLISFSILHWVVGCATASAEQTKRLGGPCRLLQSPVGRTVHGVSTGHPCCLGTRRGGTHQRSVRPHVNWFPLLPRFLHCRSSHTCMCRQQTSVPFHAQSLSDCMHDALCKWRRIHRSVESWRCCCGCERPGAVNRSHQDHPYTRSKLRGAPERRWREVSTPAPNPLPRRASCCCFCSSGG